ncbi:MAG: IPT/TIG domain-containing protein [bacterium]
MTVTATPSFSATSTPQPAASSTPTLTAQPTAVPTPYLAAVLPVSVTAGVAMDLTLTGANFTPGDWVLVGGTSYQPITGSSTQMVVALPGQTQSVAPDDVQVGSLLDGTTIESNAQPLTVVKPADTATATPAPNGPLTIVGLDPVPNPNPGQLALELAGPADSVTVRAFTKALVLALKFSYSDNLHAGWQSVPLPATWANLPNGIYYVQVQAQRGAILSLPKFVKAMILK